MLQIVISILKQLLCNMIYLCTFLWKITILFKYKEN